MQRHRHAVGGQGLLLLGQPLRLIAEEPCRGARQLDSRLPASCRSILQLIQIQGAVAVRGQHLQLTACGIAHGAADQLGRIQAGELGRVLQITTVRQGGFPARIADVGVVKDLGTHDIDLTAWLADSPFTRVAAETMTNSGREHEDMVVASGRLECGVITSHVVNWLSPVKIRQTVVTGELGAFVADTVHADLTFQANGSVRTRWDAVSAFRGVSEGDVTRLAIEKPEPLHTEHEAFRDAILGVRQEHVSMAEGLDTLRVAEAMIASARTGESVTL